LTECPICGRKTSDDNRFCGYHQGALKKLEKGLEGWKKALDLDWENYLLRVYEVEGLGLWIQEMIDYIMSEKSI
jgi:hypothetical protein